MRRGDGSERGAAEGGGSTARISAGPRTHWDARPVFSTTGVLNPWQRQPWMVTGAPPPLPGTFPEASAAEYARSTERATEQATEPCSTSTTIVTPAAVSPVPQWAADAGAVDGRCARGASPDGEQPAATAATAKATIGVTAAGRFSQRPMEPPSAHFIMP